MLGREMMTREEAIEELKTWQDDDTDWEIAHGRADAILCELLVVLGYEDVVKEWDAVPKWYA